MAKGISAIISIVLLLMITISLIGFAWIWFSRLGSDLQNSTESNLEKTSTGMLKRVVIENAVSGGTSYIALRNIGTGNLTKNDIEIYVDGVHVDGGCNELTGNLAPGDVVMCSFMRQCSGLKVKVTTSGGSDEKTC